MTQSTSLFFVRVAALFGATAVALGAMGAHGQVGTYLEQSGKLDIWKTAALYHMVHAVALLAVAAHAMPRKVVCWLWILGMVFFSGSLYALALHPAWKWLGPVTPVGGLFLLAGWISMMRKPTVRPQ